LADKNKAGGLTIYQGYVLVAADGRYTFAFSTGGRAYIRLHDATLIDADFGYHQGEKRTQSVSLKAGLHPVSIYFYPGASGPDFTLSCIGPDGTEVLRPNNIFH
jgi:hypothetical protein